MTYHWFSLKLNWLLAVLTLLGPTLGALILYVLPKVYKDLENRLEVIISYSPLILALGSVVLYALVLKMVTDCKRNKHFLVFRRLGGYDICYWTSLWLFIAPFGLFSSILGILVFKWCCPMAPLQMIDTMVLILLQFSFSMAMCSLAMLWGSLISRPALVKTFYLLGFFGTFAFYSFYSVAYFGIKEESKTAQNDPTNLWGVYIYMQLFGWKQLLVSFFYPMADYAKIFGDMLLVTVPGSALGSSHPFGFDTLSKSLYASTTASMLVLTLM